MYARPNKNANTVHWSAAETTKAHDQALMDSERAGKKNWMFSCFFCFFFFFALTELRSSKHLPGYQREESRLSILRKRASQQADLGTGSSWLTLQKGRKCSQIQPRLREKSNQLSSLVLRWPRALPGMDVHTPKEQTRSWRNSSKEVVHSVDSQEALGFCASFYFITVINEFYIQRSVTTPKGLFVLFCFLIYLDISWGRASPACCWRLRSSEGLIEAADQEASQKCKGKIGQDELQHRWVILKRKGHQWIRDLFIGCKLEN